MGLHAGLEEPCKVKTLKIAKAAAIHNSGDWQNVYSQVFSTGMSLNRKGDWTSLEFSSRVDKVSI